MTLKLFRNARIFTPRDPGTALSGQAQGEVQAFLKGAMVIKDGYIEDVGDEGKVLAKLKPHEIDWEINCGGQCIIPGFVDSHTHMCFAESREEEFALRINGTPYLDILAQGGGILSSVRAVRASDPKELFDATCRNTSKALALGTTTLEIKSGYGLDLENELKMLAVIAEVARTTPLDVAATFLGAHAVPEEYASCPEDFVTCLIDEMLPAVKTQNIAAFCDVFCEKGVFSADQTQRILTAAKALGFKLKLHADEVHDLGGAGLAARLGAVSADHLLAAGDEGFAAMAQAGTMAVLLPATAYCLKKNYAPARKMVAAGVPVALATDCNPGSSFTESMPFVFGLAVLNMDLSPAEALTAATLNGAYALDMAGQVGSLDRGKQADFMMLEGRSPAVLAYRAGGFPVTAVYKKGERVA